MVIAHMKPTTEQISSYSTFDTIHQILLIKPGVYVFFTQNVITT
jgi:hypothetical protein